MIVNEIFYSLQGEGLLAGVPSVFIRLAGCPLRCKWCDTKYAWPLEAGRHYDIAEIVQQVQSWYCRKVVITGGEPMFSPGLLELVERLKSAGKHITIETAGVVYVGSLPCDLMSISPKLRNSIPDDQASTAIHEQCRLDLNELDALLAHYNYQLKFVIESAEDLPEIQGIIKNLEHIDLQKVMLMPQAATRDELIEKSPMVAELCTQTGFLFCQRLQVLLWNNQKGC